MKEAFKDWNPKEDTLEIVTMCNNIIEEYQKQDLKLTLRQLYYQFVSRDLIENTNSAYKKLGTIVANARMAGMMDWEAIEDRGRQPDTQPEYSGLTQLVRSSLHWYRLDRWRNQLYYAELWVEKAALAGVLAPLAEEFHVTLMVNKGYSSASAMYESSKRITRNCMGKEAVIFYLGDHDPSGQDMVRDIDERLNLFAPNVGIRIKSIALTTEQVREHRPPPNPTKLTDSRAKTYIDRHGMECWEVDALDPATLQQLIRYEFEDIIDVGEMDAVKEAEEDDKRRLMEAVEGLED